MAAGPTQAEAKFYQKTAVFVQILSTTLDSNPESLFPPTPVQRAQVTNGPLRKQPISEELRRSVSGLHQVQSPSTDSPEDR